LYPWWLLLGANFYEKALFVKLTALPSFG
ncbi:MAG: hypothetical protein K0S10_3104, partial [Rubrobacteraceae bacterium]|nr:hypothetical protein [Rubrobacteraceae bacterium]